VSRFLRIYILVNFLLAVDIFLTIFVPFVIIFLINILISYKLLRASCCLKSIRQSSSNLPLEAHSFMSPSEPNQGQHDAATRATFLHAHHQHRFSVTNLSLREISTHVGSNTRKIRMRSYLKMTRKLFLVTTTVLLLNVPLVYLDFENFPAYMSVFIEELQFLLSPTRFPSALINSSSNTSSYEEEYETLALFNSTILTEQRLLLGQNSRNETTLNDILRFGSYPLYYLNFSINFLIYAFKPKMLLSAKFLRASFFKSESVVVRRRLPSSPV
jgi:hypothetical protein